ncbi:DoxX family protein [Luedemannella flava]|uniref:DoxX family protein n=1 Tax=Luedemannella flava TaxID=349316 RepID=A0ABP4YN25_9ACTN
MQLINRLNGPVVSLFRIVVGLLFLIHGASSLFGVFGGARGTGKAVEFGVWPSWWAALIQLVCGALVMIGLGTRIAAVLASGSMAYAYFTVHAGEALWPIQNGGELAAMFAWSFLLLVATGAGPWSLDALIAANRSPAAPQPSEAGA